MEPEALARQLHARGSASWSLLAALAREARPEERPALAAIVEAAGGTEPRCVVVACELRGDLAGLRAALATATDDGARGTWIAALPADEREAALGEALTRALALADDGARWAACDALTADLARDDEARWVRWFAAESTRRFGRASDDPERPLGAPPTPSQRAARIARERATWGASFEAWRLGRDGELDAAIDAFAELVDTPIDPGNDEGPFWAIAHELSLPQVRRACAILARMDARAWCYELAGSKAALAGRLAWLGEADDARALLRTIGRDGAFDATWRATAWGGWASGRLAHEPTLSLAAALAEIEAEDPAMLGDPECLRGLLAELHHRWFEHRPARAPELGEEPVGRYGLPLDRLAKRSPYGGERLALLGEASLAVVLALRARDLPRGRSALADALDTWGADLPATRWLAAIADDPDGEARVDLLEALVEHHAEALPALLAELRRTPAPYPVPMLQLLLAHAVAPAELLPVWTAWLAAPVPRWFGDPGEHDAILARAVAALGGPAAPAIVCRALGRR